MLFCNSGFREGRRRTCIRGHVKFARFTRSSRGSRKQSFALTRCALKNFGLAAWKIAKQFSLRGCVPRSRTWGLRGILGSFEDTPLTCLGQVLTVYRAGKIFMKDGLRQHSSGFFRQILPPPPLWNFCMHNSLSKEKNSQFTLIFCKIQIAIAEIDKTKRVVTKS